MVHSSVQTIRDEHSAIAATLRALGAMVERGPGDEPERYFDVMRATLFYIDEFPERKHHPKESQLLFPQIARRTSECKDVLAHLEKDHVGSERAIRELQHLLLAWELVGDSRRQEFEAAAHKYLLHYHRHMQLEDSIILPLAERVLDEADWLLLDAAFASSSDPLTGKFPRDPIFDRLFARIVMSQTSS